MTPAERAIVQTVVDACDAWTKTNEIGAVDLVCEDVLLPLQQLLGTSSFRDVAAVRSAAQFVKTIAQTFRHTEAVADCPHCNLTFLADRVLEVLGPEPVRIAPPGPPNPPKRVANIPPTPHTIVTRRRGEWHEDDGPVLWWRFPIVEPPYAGTPLDSDWPFPMNELSALGWTPLLVPAEPQR
jgi:hypothetical protein